MRRLSYRDTKVSYGRSQTGVKNNHRNAATEPDHPLSSPSRGWPPGQNLSPAHRAGDGHRALRARADGGRGGHARRRVPRYSLSLLPEPQQAGRGDGAPQPGPGAQLAVYLQGRARPRGGSVRTDLPALQGVRAAAARGADGRGRASAAGARRPAGGGALPARLPDRHPGARGRAAQGRAGTEGHPPPGHGPGAGLRHRAVRDLEGHLRRHRPRGGGLARWMANVLVEAALRDARKTDGQRAAAATLATRSKQPSRGGRVLQLGSLPTERRRASA